MENQVKNNNEDSSHNMEQPKYQDQGSAPDIEFKGEELKHRLEDEPGSLGIDLDGTNPGSRSHPMDDELPDQAPAEEAPLEKNSKDHNTNDGHMKIDEEGNELDAEDQV